ncbi:MULTISPECIES: thiolase family protein [Bacillaceae]|jgi:acetyl-CoA C-acetyltransferase|uniref:acetyl-CoA C-acetyltransferase n=1 Tax=Niallia hominis TaxID=3133173 RepID=A0ABV1F0X1_9BACI|nr:MULTISPECIES: thiolase family protein [Bacillaceae]MCF2647077.1 thiolase family protein [Niallia circulans]CAI9392952.1 Acetyl-CoA acetyltransferase [Bacillus sp. T2.9-1]
MANLKEVVIVSGSRTAIGKFGGSLKDIHVTDLAATVVKDAVIKAGISSNEVDELIVGNVGQIAENGFIGRVVSLKADLPLETTAYSVNRQCGSGLQAIVDGMLEIQTGNADVVVACGTENMSQLPYYDKGSRFGYKMGNGVLEDGLLTILTWPGGPYHNGTTAENVAERYHVSRKEQDEFSIQSQEKAIKAIEEGKFKDEIVPIELKDRKGNVSYFDTDEHPRAGLTIEKLSKMKPAFKENGSVTAANASGINDGAAAVVLMSKEKAVELGIKPILKIKGYAVAGNEPELMGYAPKLSTEKLAKKLKVNLQEIDLFEINEAFASQAFAVIRDLEINPNKVNVNGGAISLGHPVGATGVILAVKMMYEMQRTNQNTGIISMCIGGGQGISALFERCE